MPTRKLPPELQPLGNFLKDLWESELRNVEEQHSNVQDIITKRLNTLDKEGILKHTDNTPSAIEMRTLIGNKIKAENLSKLEGSAESTFLKKIAVLTKEGIATNEDIEKVLHPDMIPKFKKAIKPTPSTTSSPCGSGSGYRSPC